MKSYKILIMALAIIASPLTLAQTELLIPRSSGDNANYYLLAMAIKGDVVSASSSRVSAISVSYSKTETNCNTMKMRELAFGESLADLIVSPTKWFDLVDGSSKSDLAHFVCAIKAVQAAP